MHGFPLPLGQCFYIFAMWQVDQSALFLIPGQAIDAALQPKFKKYPRQRCAALDSTTTAQRVTVAASDFQSGWPNAGVASAAVGLAVAFSARCGHDRRKKASSRRTGAVGRVRRAAGAAVAEKTAFADFGITAFPFSAVVGQDEMKLALMLNMVDPVIGGVLIQGERGTGKSTAVRALVRLLPDIPIVADDKYNSDPENSSGQSDEVRDRLAAGEDLPVEMRRTPFVELPLGATEDRVTGTIDIERALLEGGKAFEPGILARVNRGILYIDEVNLLDDQIVDVLLDSAASGWNTVEREGVSVRHPARFLLIGTAHPDEGDLRPQLLDRFGMTVGVRTANGADWRFEVLRRTNQWGQDPVKVEQTFGGADEALKAKILEARSKLSSIKVDRGLKVKISTLCSLLNVDGLRGDIVLNRAARALVAFEGRDEVTEEDVRRVAVSCLQHRLRQNVVSDSVDNRDRVVEALISQFGAGPPPPKTD